MCFAPQRRALFRHLNFQKCSEHVVLCTFWLGNVLRATTACIFSTSQLLKVVRTWCVLMCFVHFDFHMCFAPQRSALFRHLNFQKCFDPGVLCTFWLRNVLRATTACILGMSHLARWLRTRRFSEPTFWPSGAQTIEKTQWIATLLPFHAPASSFFWLFLFSYLLSSLLFSSLLFSGSSHLCFSISPFCRKFDF